MDKLYVQVVHATVQGPGRNRGEKELRMAASELTGPAGGGSSSSRDLTGVRNLRACVYLTRWGLVGGLGWLWAPSHCLGAPCSVELVALGKESWVFGEPWWG